MKSNTDIGGIIIGIIFLLSLLSYDLEVGVIIVGIFLFIALIGWIFDQIGKRSEERKRTIRDGIAKELLPKAKIDEGLVSNYRKKLEKVRDSGKYVSRIDLGQCPTCYKGYLRVIEALNGKFIVCSNRPECKYVRPLGRAAVEYKQYVESARQGFMELLKLAYSK